MRSLFLLMAVLFEGIQAFSPPPLGAFPVHALRRAAGLDGRSIRRGLVAGRPRYCEKICLAEGDGEGEVFNPGSIQPPPIDPSIFLPPGFLTPDQERAARRAKPGKSRYEGFYVAESEAIDVDAQQDGDGEVASNPFFVGYETEELAFVWDVHVDTVGERSFEEEKEEKDELPGVLGGGLHDMILAACAEADKDKEMKSNEAPNEGKGGMLPDSILGSLTEAGGTRSEENQIPKKLKKGLHELILEACAEEDEKRKQQKESEA